MKPVSRRRAREVALQVLYCLDANPELDAPAALNMYFDRFADFVDGDAAPDATRDQPEPDRIDRPFLEAMVRGVAARGRGQGRAHST